MGTLKKRIEINEELDKPNVVKVISEVNNYAIYVLRYCMTYERDGRWLFTINILGHMDIKHGF